MARYLNYSADEINALLAKITPMLSELAEVANSGAKNILENANETRVLYDVTFTRNSDGSVTANGTATGGDAIYVISNKDDYTAGKTYVLSGCPAGGGETTYRLQISGIAQDWGSGTEFESAASMNTYIRIAENYHADNLTFYPMIRPVEISDDNYVPYGKSNGDLTTEVTDIFNGVFGNGITLASGDDLDDLTTPGKYAARAADIAGTIQNKPTGVGNVAFCVEVSMTTASNRLIQTLYVNTNDGAFYQRKLLKSGNTSAWTGWAKFSAGGGSYSETELLSAPLVGTISTISLSDDMTNYDQLVFTFGVTADNQDWTFTKTLLVSNFGGSKNFYLDGMVYSNNYWSVHYAIRKYDDTTFTVENQGQYQWSEQRTIFSIKGIKY